MSSVNKSRPLRKSGETTSAKQSNVSFGFLYLFLSTLLLVICYYTDWVIGNFAFYQLVFFATVPVVLYMKIMDRIDINAVSLAFLSLLQPILMFFLFFKFITPPLSSSVTINSVQKSIIIFPIYVLAAALILVFVAKKASFKNVFDFESFLAYFPKDRKWKTIERIIGLLAAIVSILAYIKVTI